MIPDTSDDAKMARAGRLYTLRGARRKAAQKLRDALIPVLNNIENERGAWEVSGIVDLVNEINELTQAIDALDHLAG